VIRDLVPELKAVLLDAGGVLLMPDPRAAETHLAQFGVAPDVGAMLAAYHAGMVEIDRLGVADFGAADRAVARALGVAEAQLDAALEAIWRVYQDEPWIAIPGVARQLERLRDAGYALAVVSNASGTVEQQLASHRVCSVDGKEAAEVAVVVDSHRVGVEKPDPAIFSFALDALGLPPSSCIHVGDSVHFDVNGARAAGIEPVHVTSGSPCAVSGHHCARSLEAVVEDLLS